ncbi:MAG TPA: hypothetical protein VFC39_20920 [Acidobacteriaceae bacterium]|nr:hypothetical protein [Acidobacteriaceae bacterium]
MSLPLVLVAAYFAFTVLIAVRSSRQQGTSNSFLNATGTLPTWVVTLSFLAANCGALEIVGLSGVAARYGVQAFHFYWIGAIPALIFVSFVILPVYERLGVRSVPEFLERKFGREVRLLNACLLLVSTCLTAGVSLYALAEVLHVAGGWSFTSCVLATSTVVMVNVLIGGFRGTMRTEVLHFFFMVAGLLPMLFLSQHRGNAVQRLGTQVHAWRMTPVVSNAAPVDLLGVVVGLGLVIGFSYWCTDFLMMQRALAARTAESARRVPLYAGFGKLMFGFLVVFPVLRAGYIGAAGRGALDQTAPLLMRSLYGPKLLALGMIALVASLMTGVVGNVSAFAALWTQEIYRTALRPGKIERHYIRIGRAASVVCIVLSLGGALGTLWFESLTQFLLAIFSLYLVPFFAVILASVTSRRYKTRNVIVAVLAGVAVGGVGQVAYGLHWLPAGSQLNANLRIAIAVFVTTFGLCLATSRGPREDERREDDFATMAGKTSISPSLYFLAALLVSCCLLCNVIWF